MVTVNLFPWREKLRVYQERRLTQILWAMFFIATLLSLILYGVLLHNEHQARLRLAVIKQELKRYAGLQARVDAKAREVASLSMIRELLAEQDAVKTFFEGLGAKYDNDVCFTSMARDHQKIIFSGRTRSTTDLSQFFHTWQLAELFSAFQIEKLEQTSEQQMQFRFQANLYAV